MTTQRVWPGLSSSGTSLTVYAEDGVTLIPAAGGADVTLIQEQDGGPFVLPAYYRNKVAISVLLTYDPLGLSGDPISINPVTRISAGLVGVLTSELPSRPGLADKEHVSTVGFSDPGDNGAATWQFRFGVSAGANGLTKINTTNGQYQMLVGYNQAINLRAVGWKKDSSTNCDTILNSAWAARSAQLPEGGMIWFHIDEQVTEYDTAESYYFGATGATIPSGNLWTFKLTGAGARCGGTTPYGHSFWATDGAMTGSVIRCAQGVSAFVAQPTGSSVELDFSDFGLIGGGRGDDNYGIYLYNSTNCRTRTARLIIANFYAGLVHENEISGRHQDNRIAGCFYGEMANPSISSAGSGFTDSDMLKADFAGCNIGLWVYGGLNNEFQGYVIQGCAKGTRWGGTQFLAAGGYGKVVCNRWHFEGNGHYRLGGTTIVTQFTRADCVTVTTANDTLSGLAARNGYAPAAGTRVLVTAQTNPANNGVYLAAVGAWTKTDVGSTHAGCLYKITNGSQANTFWQIDNYTPAFDTDGDPMVIAQTAQDWDMEFLATTTSGPVFEKIGFQSGYSCTVTPFSSSWYSCSGGAQLIASSAQVIDTYSCQWESVTVDINCKYTRTVPSYPTRGAVTSGTLDHNWGNQGEVFSLVMTGNVTLNAPTNMPLGAKWTVIALQSGAGGYSISFGPNIACTGYSNTGNVLGSGILLEFTCINVGSWRGSATAWS